MYTLDCSAQLGTLAAEACAPMLGRIIGFALQKKQASPFFDGTTLVITDLDDWATARSASDATKIVNSRRLANASLVAGDATKFGTRGGNDTPYGQEMVMSKGTSMFSANFFEANEATFDTLKAWAGLNLSGTNLLTAYFFDEFGNVFARTTDGTAYEGFSIAPNSLFVSDISKNGTDPAGFMVEFQLLAGETQNSKVVAVPGVF